MDFGDDIFFFKSINRPRYENGVTQGGKLSDKKEKQGDTTFYIKQFLEMMKSTYKKNPQIGDFLFNFFFL
ncbi:MAG: hypothetical protein ACTSXV_01685 [Alphaproteobacteria bacterium]